MYVDLGTAGLKPSADYLYANNPVHNTFRYIGSRSADLMCAIYLIERRRLTEAGDEGSIDRTHKPDVFVRYVFQMAYIRP
jgi:hypothetical protein